MNKKILIAIILAITVTIPVILIYFEEEEIDINEKPLVEIIYPKNRATVSKIVIISGFASDPDGDVESLKVDVMVNGEWSKAEGTTKWSYEWETFGLEEGYYNISVRSYDGIDYSEIQEIRVNLKNPETVESDSHKWAIFIAASNFPEDNESKLGNGALNLAEDMSEYFIKNLGYSTENIIILFDDGWIRDDNGKGETKETLQQRKHKYDITYAAATKKTVISSIDYIVEESNKFDDSEVFVWIASHGCGDQDKKLFGGKLLERSAIFLWDGILSDIKLGDLLSSLRSDRTCVIVDACYSGGFADRTILNLPELLFKSDLPYPGRVILTGASKFRVGYASTINGPLFSQLWFQGITTGEADGFRPGFLDIGRSTILKMFKDGKVSVEEAFYYARYTLRKNPDLKDYRKMEPQINDQYPRNGPIGSSKGLVLGE